VILLIGSIYLLYKYINGINYIIAEISLLLFTPYFWFKAFRYIIIQSIKTLFSESLTQSIFSIFDKYIQEPIIHYKNKLLSWYNSLTKPKKIILWIFIILFGFVLILLVLRSPMIIKLFWKKGMKFIAAKSAKFILTPYIEKIVAIISSFIIYRLIRIYLVKKVVRPIKRKVIKSSS
jgi:hypothetical protein